MTKKTILVVDDDVLILKIISRIFSTNGFEVLQAANGKEALDLLNSYEQNIDLIITDYNMPNMNGLEMANATKTHEKYNDTPLILITANSEIGSFLGEQRDVFNEVIHKPFSSEFILNKVAGLLGK